MPNEAHPDESKLDFSFECIEFTEYIIKLQLRYLNPLQVSAYVDDLLEIRIIDNYFFELDDTEES
jgi:hypothetical protein